MNKEFNSRNLDNDEFYIDNEESDYSNLISRLKEIKTSIDLLVKTLF